MKTNKYELLYKRFIKERNNENIYSHSFVEFVSWLDERRNKKKAKKEAEKIGEPLVYKVSKPYYHDGSPCQPNNTKGKYGYVTTNDGGGRLLLQFDDIDKSDWSTVIHYQILEEVKVLPPKGNTGDICQK